MLPEIFYPRNSINYYKPPTNDLPHLPEGDVFSLRVGYVSTGFRHMDRTPAHVVIIDKYGNLQCSLYIRPNKQVISYLTPLNSINEGIVARYGLPPQTVFSLLEEVLNPDTVLVGHYPEPDIKALGLRKGIHYRHAMDLKKLWKV